MGVGWGVGSEEEIILKGIDGFDVSGKCDMGTKIGEGRINDTLIRR